jgi:hypothetical protein
MSQAQVASRAPSTIVAPISERQVQRQILRMCGHCFADVLIHHSPNGTKLAGSKRDRQVTGGILKGDGTKPGWPDLAFVWKGGGAFIEVKRPGGRLSPDQKAIHEHLRSLSWPVETVDNVNDAYRFLIRCGAPCSGELVGVGL